MIAIRCFVDQTNVVQIDRTARLLFISLNHIHLLWLPYHSIKGTVPEFSMLFLEPEQAARLRAGAASG